ncbi:two-component system, chemotaxis family, sensor histidine kinase and response regulator WspE [Mariprofundus micogutta]|uniref:Chemotaxis protein CheA n=1 Tax=Mariprofundus micogutta TaxID=1921010 RepID=A0A1L8CLX7_9PROT|nr:hybrid sensor histidine kinase/response regulator [Mariprofundus micogutta]GAV19912.1 two-component system, chemotaxis family, sensor histidine kinase and response regulator WspE [Mariprofundus micogutta]
MTKFDTSGFLASFFDEAKERLISINRRVVLLESGNLDEESLTQLRRDAHNIKGSAQMLGVQDVSDVIHLFEDAMEFVIEHTHVRSQSMIQLLYDLHDQLAERVNHVDGEVHIDVTPLHERFRELSDHYEQQEQDSALPEELPQEESLKPRRKKKKHRVNRNLIAAVMGTIESSLETEKSVAPEETLPTLVTKPAIEKEVVREIDFRPVLDQLEDNSTPENSSGSFLRVDRSRLDRLSNQIIEFSSERYRGGSMPEQLERLQGDFKQLKNKVFSDDFIQSEKSSQNARLQVEFDQALRDIQTFRDTFRMFQKRSLLMQGGLRDQVFGLMLRPLGSVFSIFPRAVRDISQRYDKKVQLLVSGENVEMDQIAAQALSESLIHLINNAVVHGVETPGVRKGLNKPEEGQITISAIRKGTGICIEVIDDGAGIDTDKIRKKAMEQGIISESEASEMDTPEVLELIFHSGFSTAANTDSVAGRGVGLSVVLEAMRELTGTVHVESEQGKGSKFILTLPVSVTVQKAVSFRIANNHFGLLSQFIHQVLPLNEEEIKRGHGPFSQGYLKHEGHRVPVIDLHQALGGGNATSTSTQASLVIVEHIEGFLGIVVDDVYEEREIIVREIDPYLKYYHPLGLMGNAIADDGSVLLLIEPNGLKEMWRTAPDVEYTSELLQGKDIFDQHLLLVDDSTIALEIEKHLFESFGFIVDTAVGGEDALDKLALNSYALLVTDLDMPGINGVDLIKRVRISEDKSAASTPIMVMASRDSDNDQRSALDAGANTYVVKRHLKDNLDDLIERLNGLLSSIPG